MEFWIIPEKHDANLLTLSQSDVKTLAQTLKTCLSGLKRLVNDPPYNYGIHLALNKDARDYYHWHLEVYPQLAIWAGFEKSTGMYINTVTPETAAETMRNTVSS
jgi:UDPglucose--hexose-1-phosphate uridylyltransferase